ncbi:15826_t:CDS:1 [Dentiscutata erythropus]|uniref:15826_t:CDS:1 n=1 Tax=Dentiscutata erythropus TaxID=1348616 RepID=A0A9N8ZEI1_9GLOM|nr:15826_t:CDS:1 [Dentiscutata erythropus]
MHSSTDFDYPLGGRLRYYTDEWLENFGNQLATKVVQWGYRPRWEAYPPLRFHPITDQPYISNYNETRREITRLLEERVIRRFSMRNQCFLSESSLKRKKNGNYRLVPNLRNLNDYVRRMPFTMDEMKVEELIQQNDFMVSVDLEEAFYHIPLHPEAQKYFVFDFDYQRYCFQCLPFSLTTSSWIFKTVLQPIIDMIRSNRIKIVVHCDDMLIMSRNRREAERHRDIVIDLLETHGFIINESKSQLTPTRSIEYLGRVINSNQMIFSAPEYKIEKLLDECEDVYNQRYIDIRTLTSLISKLHNIVQDHEFTRELRRDKNSHLRRGQYSRIQLSQEGREELEDWMTNIWEWNGYPIQ